MVIDVEKIVFFFNEDTENNEKQACVFYTDGSREIVSYEDAKRLAAKTALERKMTSSNLRNNDIIFFERSKKDLKEKHSFVEEETNNIDLNEVFAKREVKSEKKKKKIPFNLRVAAGFVAGVVGLGASVILIVVTPLVLDVDITGDTPSSPSIFTHTYEDTFVLSACFESEYVPIYVPGSSPEFPVKV